MAHTTRTNPWIVGAFLSTSILMVQDIRATAPKVRDLETQTVVRSAESVDDAESVREFQRRLQQYDGLRRRLHAYLPTPTVSDDPATILEVVNVHKTALRSARYGAAQGDIFFDGVAQVFRARIRESLHGVPAREFLAMITESDALPMARPSVNASYPNGGALTTMPPSLLQMLPPLPAGLHYRFVDRDLILWDPHANLIIDFIPNALLIPDGT